MSDAAEAAGAQPLYPVLDVESLQRRYGDATVIDVTSRGPQPWIRFSPFYPHGGIPVPCSSNAQSVGYGWQEMKSTGSCSRTQ